MYDYEAFYKRHPVDIHNQATRHGKIAELCRGYVYDIGCGTGTLADYYLGKYLGFDISQTAIDLAKKTRRPNCDFMQLDAMTLHNEDFAKADTIVLSEFLEHIENDDNIFKSIMRTARRGTRLVVSVPNGHAIPVDEHVREFTVSSLRAKFQKFGNVKFYNWPDEKIQIIMTCDIGEPQRADLSLVMIVKNEEKGLEKACLSAIEYVDEIIIAVDNSSTDRTGEIAMMYADTIKKYEWKDNFAEARNSAQEGAHGKWLMFLDGHEYIGKGENIREFLKSGSDAIMCKIEMENGMEFNNPRIYKNGVKLQGAVHEKIDAENIIFAKSIVIKHDRLSSQSAEGAEARKKQRDEQVPRIMGQQYKENPKNLRASFHLGLHYAGRQQHKESRKWFKRYLQFSQNNQERWFVYFQIALGYLMEKKPLRAGWAANYAEQEMPGRWEIRKLKGLIEFTKGRYEQASELYVESLAGEQIMADYKPWKPDQAGTFNAIGECLFRMENYTKAVQAFDAASERASEPISKKFFKDRADIVRQLIK